jgi:hypothetical protein
MIFSFLLEEDKPIVMTTNKRTDESRRSVRLGWNVRTGHEGVKWDSNKKGWINNPPSAFAILRVSKQILQETAPIAYGNNSFAFPKMTALKYFLEALGTMYGTLSPRLYSR